MSMNVGGKKGSVMAEINVTPMADIMIVLLIIFMVITPMLQKGVDVRLPTAANTDEKADNKDNVVVAIKSNSTVFLNGICMAGRCPAAPPAGCAIDDNLRLSLRELGLAEEEYGPFLCELNRKVYDQPDLKKIVFLKADVTLAYSEVMKIMDMCRVAKAEEIALIAEKKVQG